MTKKKNALIAILSLALLIVFFAGQAQLKEQRRKTRAAYSKILIVTLANVPAHQRLSLASVLLKTDEFNETTGGQLKAQESLADGQGAGCGLFSFLYSEVNGYMAEVGNPNDADGQRLLQWLRELEALGNGQCMPTTNDTIIPWGE